MGLGHYLIPPHEKRFFWGELRLDGKIQSPKAILSHLLFAAQKNSSSLWLNTQDIHSPIFSKTSLYHLQSISDLLSDLNPQKTSSLETQSTGEDWIKKLPSSSIWNQLRGDRDQFLIFALAAIGRHHLLLEGSPGVGKSTWCLAFREILPPLSEDLWRERVQAAPLFLPSDLDNSMTGFQSPFESPHSSSSVQAVVGGGSKRIDPGAITRAHQGVLFLDEIPEFARGVRECLRQPLEMKSISIARGGVAAQLPADFQLLATMNPCACGYFESPRRCECSATQLQNYRGRISGPLLDRIHFYLWWQFIDQPIPEEFSLLCLRARIQEARHRSPPQIDVDLIPQVLAPRRRRLWRDIFDSWCRFYGVDHATEKEARDFREFYDKIQAENLKAQNKRIAAKL